MLTNQSTKAVKLLFKCILTMRIRKQYTKSYLVYIPKISEY